MNSPERIDSATGSRTGESAADILVAAGWQRQSDDRWLSPLTNRPHVERVALMLCQLPGNVTTLRQVKERKARFRQQRVTRR